MTEREQPASEGKDCPHERFITITHAGGQEKQCSECGVLVEPSTTEPEQPAGEGEESSLGKICTRCGWLSNDSESRSCRHGGIHVFEPSTTEREQGPQPGALLPMLEIFDDFEDCLTGFLSRSDQVREWRQHYAKKALALLAQPTAPSKKWTPAALAEWTPEQWAAALDTARTDLMCAEDFEPSDVAHVMNICAQVLRRPREQGERIEAEIHNGELSNLEMGLMTKVHLLRPITGAPKFTRVTLIIHRESMEKILEDFEPAGDEDE